MNTLFKGIGMNDSNKQELNGIREETETCVIGGRRKLV